MGIHTANHMASQCIYLGQKHRLPAFLQNFEQKKENCWTFVKENFAYLYLNKTPTCVQDKLHLEMLWWHL